MACGTKKRAKKKCGGPVKKANGGAVNSKMPKKRTGGGISGRLKGLPVKK